MPFGEFVDGVIRTIGSEIDALGPNADVEILLQLVLMEGFEMESELTHESLDEMRLAQEQKSALRTLETSAKKHRDEITWQIVLELERTSEKDLKHPRRRSWL